MTKHRILQYWHDVHIGGDTILHVVPVQTYEEIGKVLFDRLIEEVKKAGFSYRITERTETELERVFK